jgi:hypothetical protein
MGALLDLALLAGLWLAYWNAWSPRGYSLKRREQPQDQWCYHQRKEMRIPRTLVRVGLSCVFMRFFLMLLGGIQQETGLLPPEIGLAQWGPGSAGMLMLLTLRRDGHRITLINREGRADSGEPC